MISHFTQLQFQNRDKKLQNITLIAGNGSYANEVKNDRLQEYHIFVKNVINPFEGTVGMNFLFRRHSFPYIFKYYLPCSGLVALTSLSFFISPKMVPGRGGIMVTLFLVLNNISGYSKVIIF